jgi:hypothetical protein
MSALLTAILPALLPAAADGIRGIFARITNGKGAQPLNVAEVIQLMTAETDRLKTIAQLDAPAGEIFKWAATARALQRPALSTLIIVAYAVTILWGEASQDTIDTLGSYAQMVTFYLFGDRAYNWVKRNR